MAVRRSVARAPAAHRAPTGERITRIETVLEEVADTMKAMSDAMKGLADKSAVEDLVSRVAELEGARKFAAGAAKVESRVRERIMDIVTPMLWPAVGALYVILQQFGGGQ